MHTTYIRNNIGQKCEGNCDLWILNEIIKRINPESLKKKYGWRLGVTTQIGLDWLCYLVDNSQTAPHFFSNYYLIKNLQTINVHCLGSGLKCPSTP